MLIVGILTPRLRADPIKALGESAFLDELLFELSQ